MKNYLSFGGGVNSTAMYLMLLDQGVEFEAVYVDHGCDWPETREFVETFSKKYPLTILKVANLYNYAWEYKMVPSQRIRWCTRLFKIKILTEYVEKPCFQLIGFDTDEPHRAKYSCTGGIENRWPLLEENISRNDCVEIIKNHGIDVPIKSGCWFCPYMRISQWKKLRREHPDLFCRAVQLEKRNMEYKTNKGKRVYTLHSSGRTLEQLINEDQMALPGLEEIEYPPCQCGL